MSHKPRADKGLIAFRYKGKYGWIFIGATDIKDALVEASRSTDGPICLENLEVLDAVSNYYKPIPENPLFIIVDDNKK